MRGRVGGRIGALVLTSLRVWAGDKSTRLGGAHWARARSQWPSPFRPGSLSPPGSAAHAQGHFWHTLSVRCWSGAARQRAGRLVARSAIAALIAAWRDHHVSIGGGCHAQEQRWNGQIGGPRPLRKPPCAAVGGTSRAERACPRSRRAQPIHVAPSPRRPSAQLLVLLRLISSTISDTLRPQRHR